MRIIIHSIIAIILVPFILYAGYGLSLWILGYELGQSPEELAEKLVEQERPATDCELFRTLDFLMRPTTDELQARCVRVYADLAQDPSACELLMPSSYAISCIGSAEKEGLPSIGCHTDRDKPPYQITCLTKEGDTETAEYVIPNLGGCASFSNERAAHWCYAKRAEMQGDLESCMSHAITRDQRDDCQYKRAGYLVDLSPETCEDIEHDVLKAGCLATVNAWMKYPNLRPLRE